MTNTGKERIKESAEYERRVMQGRENMRNTKTKERKARKKKEHEKRET